MANHPRLRLDLLDVYGKKLGEPVDLRLFQQGLDQRLVVRDADASRLIVISNLDGPPHGLYRLECDPPSYLPVNRFVKVGSKVTDLALTFPVDPRKVIRMERPPFRRLIPPARELLKNSSQVLNFAGIAGPDLYSTLDEIRAAGFLNIVAKCARTKFASRQSVLEFFGELREIRGDRFFVRVTQELREETKNSVAAGLFEPVSGSLHHPPAGFTAAGSFKTKDPVGNLQLTFFSNGVDWVADADIDDANGLAHVFQVLRNALTGRPTHPYDIHQILIATQEIDPGYKLILRES